MKNYYDILGVGKTATEDDIKRAYRKLAHKYHPDKSGGDESKFKEINEAYQVLSDKGKRAQYDRFGTAGGPAGFGGAGGGFNPGAGGQWGGFGGGNVNWEAWASTRRSSVIWAISAIFSIVFSKAWAFGQNAKRTRKDLISKCRSR